MTENVNLEEVARAIAAASPNLDAEGRQVVVQTYRLLAEGEPVPPAAIAQAAGVTVEKAESVLGSSLVFRDDQDRVVRFWGLSIDRLEPTHRIEVDGRSVYGWCAWDTLFVTEVLGIETQVTSADPLTGERIRLAVTPAGVKEAHPQSTVVSFLLPDGPFGADAVQGFCHSVHFFASEQSALRWTAEHPGTFVLSMDDAFELGRLTNRLRWG